ncbi:hypothetical protein ORJ04_01370 [Rheinheimera baltica]|uniref:Tetratricopeptide repeat protein n=1 Tax=Rheinheimera baltica TaxID=67576 RepID=A0ABT9HUB9_9GAMM|nr:hypothetical protein [Rheinheimera baltica]MDP5134598.1 hypothetical protein [Rheinheimera baltica]
MRLTLLFLTLLTITPWASWSADATTPSNPSLLQQATEAMLTDLDLAEKYIKQALVSAPDNPEVHFICGRIMGQQAENAIFSALSYAKKSLTCLEQAVSMQPENTGYRRGLMSFYLGAPGIAGGDEDLAWQQVEQITKLNALQGALAKLNFYRQTEQQDQYRQLLEQSRISYPGLAEFHYRHGLLLQEQKQFSQAFSAFVAATKAADDDAGVYVFNAWYQIGRTALFSQQQLADGTHALQYFIAHAPDSDDVPEKVWAHLRLAQLHKLNNDIALMQQHLDYASQSNDKELQREIRRLQR